MAGRYVDVKVGELYLKKIFLSMGVSVDNLDITDDEIDYCETWAENQIDARLGLRFDDFPATPLIIRDIALALTAYKVRQFLLTANSPNKDDHTNSIRDEAMQLLDGIFHGNISVIMPDLTYHPRYPGPSGGERFSAQPETALRRFFTNMDRGFYEMQQDVETDGIEQEFKDKSYPDTAA